MIHIAVFDGQCYWGTFADWRNLLAILPPDALRAGWRIFVRTGSVGTHAVLELRGI